MNKFLFIGLFALFLLFSCGGDKSSGENNNSQNDQEVDNYEAVDSLNDNDNGDSTDDSENLKPFLKKSGEKFRIAIVQSGEYFEYYDVFEAMLNGLTTIGWMNELSFSGNFDRTILMLLKELKSQNYSDYIEFSEDLFFDFNWDDARIPLIKKSKIFSGVIKADLIICLGTYAADFIVNKSNYDQIPVLADAISDPVGAGIIPSIEDSGRDFLTVRCDPNVYYRQIKLFYDVVKFKKLAVLYEDTGNGRSYAGIKDVERAAKEYGFEIVKNNNVLAEPMEKDFLKAQKMYLKALEDTLPNADAIYLGVSGGLEAENVSNVVKVINKYKKPSFAMEGSRNVKKGVLLGVSASELRSTGIYNVKKIVKIFKGIKPGKLNQLFENIPSIAINLKTAEIIGYDVPIDIIGSSDEIYQNISE
ncbi:MAG TPA: ABC transporter substrate binding protein [Spirochaetota bacterium]|nr:ABC transporter substrate binding protein [Spirochaetota bacterium]